MSECKFKLNESYETVGGTRKVVYIGEHQLAVESKSGFLSSRALDGTSSTCGNLRLPKPKPFDASKPTGFLYVGKYPDSVETTAIYSKEEYEESKDEHTNWRMIPTYDIPEDMK